MYTVLFSKKAEDKLKKLPQQLQIRIISSLERIKIRPFSYAKKLSGYPYFRLRVGDYRLILDIQNDKLIILVVTMGLRKNIYDKF